MAKKTTGKRYATVILPELWNPSEQVVIEVQDETLPLPDPHNTHVANIGSTWRTNERSHHRVLYERRPKRRYRTFRVPIETTRRDVRPIHTHWTDAMQGPRIVDQDSPRVIDRMMNTRMRDVKLWERVGSAEVDDARHGSLRALDWSNPDTFFGMYRALLSGDPGIAADTAIVVRKLVGGR